VRIVLIDSHCHLHDREFYSAKQAEECLKRAHEKGIGKIVCIGTSHEDSLAAAEFAKKHKNVYWTYGIHPEFARDEQLGSKSLWDESPIAIGEVGLDYHYDEYDREAQIKLFEQMLQLAMDNNLPLSFHIRGAFQDFFPIVANFPKARGVMHSFTGSKKVLRQILDETDFYVGVNGLATYSTLPMPPLERIMLETDAPFLTPKQVRGEKNEPSHIFEIAEWLSQKLDLDYKTVEKATTKNTEKLFKI